MPYSIVKIKGTNAVKVINRNTGRVHAYHTTIQKAKSQIRLLRSKEKGR